MMKKNLILVAIALLSATTVFAAKEKQPKKKKAPFKTEIDSVSYAYGMNVGQDLKRMMESMQEKEQVSFDQKIFTKALLDALAGKETSLNTEDAKSALSTFGGKLQAKMQEREKKEAEIYKAEGEKFIAEKAKEAGVQKAASGLLYKVEKEGTGTKPVATDQVSVHYKGSLIDGTEFDSSYKRNEPLEIGVGQVIPGWTEGLQLMSVGSKYIFYIPSELGYGARKMGEEIKPNSALIFEVELLDIKKPEETQQEEKK